MQQWGVQMRKNFSYNPHYNKWLKMGNCFCLLLKDLLFKGKNAKKNTTTTKNKTTKWDE